MAVRTFGETVGLVALQVPAAPISLVQTWVQRAYDDLVGTRHWGWLRQETLLSTRAARTVTPTFTNGSTTVTSAGEFVVATDPGRQLRVSQGPVYTIDTVTDVNTAALTLAYAGDDGAATATLSDIYLAMPADFRSIESIKDLSTQRPIPWWISKERLDLFDPGRVSSDSRFRCLVSAGLSQVTSLLGRVLYEAYPHPTAAASYPLAYFRRTDVIDDETNLEGVLATHPHALEYGALAQAALWPGTAEAKNPYFNLGLADRLATRFEQARLQLDVLDDDQYLLNLQQTDLSRWGLAQLAADTTLLRQSDATIADYV